MDIREGRRIHRPASLGVSLDFETDISKLWVRELVRLDFEFEFERHPTKS